MGKKKKKIREQFDKIFRSGDEKKIKSMLNEHPWLLNEVSDKMDKNILEQRQILAATGVMEDELSIPVQIDQVMLCLKVDFNIDKSKEEVLANLTEIERLGLIKKENEGWNLTKEGGQVCDEYLNGYYKNLSL
jgi:hypothetical protein